MYNEKIGTIEGFDYYDRKQICELFNESDDKAFDYIAENCTNESLRLSASELANDGWKMDKESYEKMKWDLLKKIGCFKTKYGEAFTRI